MMFFWSLTKYVYGVQCVKLEESRCRETRVIGRRACAVVVFTSPMSGL